MSDAEINFKPPTDERRAFPRYDVSATHLSLAVEDSSLGETIGIGEAVDLSLGGLRLTRLPPRSNVQLGDQLEMLLIDEESALPLHGEVVHHGTEDSFGIKFQTLTPIEQKRVQHLLERLH